MPNGMLKSNQQLVDITEKVKPHCETTIPWRELADLFAKSLFMIFEKSWQSGEVLGDWRKGNIVLIFKNTTEVPGNYQPAGLTSLPGKIMNRSSWKPC